MYSCMHFFNIKKRSIVITVDMLTVFVFRVFHLFIFCCSIKFFIPTYNIKSYPSWASKPTVQRWRRPWPPVAQIAESGKPSTIQQQKTNNQSWHVSSCVCVCVTSQHGAQVDKASFFQHTLLPLVILKHLYFHKLSGHVWMILSFGFAAVVCYLPSLK